MCFRKQTQLESISLRNNNSISSSESIWTPNDSFNKKAEKRRELCQHPFSRFNLDKNEVNENVNFESSNTNENFESLNERFKIRAMQRNELCRLTFSRFNLNNENLDNEIL